MRINRREMDAVQEIGQGMPGCAYFDLDRRWDGKLYVDVYTNRATPTPYSGYVIAEDGSAKTGNGRVPFFQKAVA